MMTKEVDMMPRLRCCAAALAMIGAASCPVYGQGGKADVPEQSARARCVNSGKTQGLRGIDLRNHSQVCVEEEKLKCLKQAIAANVNGGRERRQYIRTCLGQTDQP
jgi:hypothetical protein